VETIAIYSVFDKDGIIDDYIFYYLDQLGSFVDHILVIVNGGYRGHFTRQLSSQNRTIIVRQNEGFDVEAYRQALFYLGRTRVESARRILLCNDSVFGPFGGFESVFRKMVPQNVDFWGITLHPRMPAGRNPRFGEVTGFREYFPEFIQTYFIAFEARLLSSGAFWAYWHDLPKIKTPDDAQLRFEASLTKYFCDLHFDFSVYCENELPSLGSSFSLDYVTFAPSLLQERYGYPFLRKKLFGWSPMNMLEMTNGNVVVRVLDNVSRLASYDMQLIYQSVLRQVPISRLKESLGLNYVLSDSFASTEETPPTRLAIVAHLYYDEDFEANIRVLEKVIGTSTLLITTSSESKREKLVALVTASRVKRFEVLVVQNRGRELAALLVGLAGKLRDFDLVAFVHDKRSSHWPSFSIGQAFRDNLWDNMLASPAYVANVLATFRENASLGVLVPPTPIHGPYFAAIGREFTSCYSVVEELHRKLRLASPISPDFLPYTMGSCFWFRPQALAPLLEHPWRYEDFSQEPMADDGTISHAIERIIGFVAQDRGFLTGWVMSQRYANTEVANLTLMLGELGRRYQQIRGVERTASFSAMASDLLGGLADDLSRLRQLERYRSWKLFQILWATLRFFRRRKT